MTIKLLRFEAEKRLLEFWIHELLMRCSYLVRYMCDSTPEDYLKLASDVDSLRKLPNYLAIQKFSDPPRLSDLDGLTLEEDDIQQLKKCKPGHCEVQLPSDAMEAFQRSVDWSAPDAADQVNRLAKEMILEALLRYQQGGNAALGTYRDKNHPAVVADTFQSLLSRSKALPVYLPELDRYLLDYPNAQSENIKSEFYWEKVNFGLKPTIRVVQAIVYRGASATDPAYAVAIKQLYASHYFETALDITVCVRDEENQKHPGIYLITLKGSQQAGLTGLEGQHSAESCCRQNAFFTGKSSCSNQTKTGSARRLTSTEA